MAYSPVAIPADGAVLPASVLNGLADNAAFLYALVSGINTGFTTYSFDGSPDPETSRTYVFRRQARYLHFRVDLLTNDVSDFDVLVDGTSEYNDPTNRSATYSYTGYIDLTGVTSAPAVGDLYEVTVELDWSVGGTARLVYLLESDATSL